MEHVSNANVKRVVMITTGDRKRAANVAAKARLPCTTHTPRLGTKLGKKVYGAQLN